MPRERLPTPAVTEPGRGSFARGSAVSEPTLASTVLDRLRADIVEGKLAPGEKLRLEHLTESYQAGRTPLREACFRLASEGLVTVEDQRGFRVSPISRADLLDLTRTRQQIESLALRASITKGDLAWEGEVTAALHRLLRRSPTPARKSSTVAAPSKAATTQKPTNRRTAFDAEALGDGWADEHARLHATLVSACDSPWLLRFQGLLYEQSERYRRLASAYGQPERDIDGEHEALVRAALARDVERACALAVEHIARTTEKVLSAHPALANDVTPDAAPQRRAR